VDASSQASIDCWNDGLPEIGPFVLARPDPGRRSRLLFIKLGMDRRMERREQPAPGFPDSSGSDLLRGVFDLGDFGWAGWTWPRARTASVYWLENGRLGPLLGVRSLRAWVGNPFLLDDDSPYDWDGEHLEDRNLSCA